jgi:oligoendopeptidase F
MTTASVTSKAQAFVDDFNQSYEEKHVAFENQFWGTKMALSSNDDVTYSTELLSKTKAGMEDLLSDSEVLKEARDHLEALKDNKDDTLVDLKKVLEVIVRTCICNEFPTKESKSVREETNRIEGSLEKARNEMDTLGYTDADGTFVPSSSVGLRNIMRTSPQESVRRSAYEGVRSIGPFVCSHGFLEIVKLRNQLARLLGFCDYYDYTVTNAEGFSKAKLFEILDGLEEGTRPLMVKARQQLEEIHGKEALDPWNSGYMMAGSVIKKMDPYFPFSKSVEIYMRSYAAMKIGYSNATMTLDLLDRKNKYSNGFCHWPVPAWVRPDGTHVPSKTNFTSLADPTAVGSGLTALNTLMHEAGHAAHFANIIQPSPLFSQERAPTSVAYAENQSMFLDSLVGDSAWRAKYAKDLEGNPIPFDIIEESLRSTHPFQVFQLRAMLCVSYFEKAMYELPDAELTSESVQLLADDIETKIQGGLSPRPLLSVPHLVSDEASCYYQGYTVGRPIVSHRFVFNYCIYIMLSTLIFCCFVALLTLVARLDTQNINQSSLVARRNVGAPNPRIFQERVRIHRRQSERGPDPEKCLLAMRKFQALPPDCQRPNRKGSHGRCLGGRPEGRSRGAYCSGKEGIPRNDRQVQQGGSCCGSFRGKKRHRRGRRNSRSTNDSPVRGRRRSHFRLERVRPLGVVPGI